MLRITTHAGAGGLSMKLEGWLRGAWVHELDSAWRQASDAGTHPLSVDLSDVHFVDEAGSELLTRMYRAGVKFRTRGCVMPELVRQIAARCPVTRRS